MVRGWRGKEGDSLVFYLVKGNFGNCDLLGVNIFINWKRSVGLIKRI